MKDSEFPIEKSKRRSNNLSRKGVQSPTVYRYVEQPSADLGAGESYDSLLDYWHILLRHRMTLLSFTVVGLLAAMLISLVPTKHQLSGDKRHQRLHRELRITRVLRRDAGQTSPERIVTGTRDR
jgi:hypothetical protein